MRRKPKFTFPARFLLILLTLCCVGLVYVSFILNISGGPLNTIAGYVFIPSAGSTMSGFGFQTKRTI